MLVRLYFDIETLGTDPFNNPLVAIGVLPEVNLKPHPPVLFKTWEYVSDAEAGVLKDFIRYVRRFDSAQLIGWNILHFDVPYLLSRASKVAPDLLRDLHRLFRDYYLIDVRQAYLYLNRFRFKGLTLGSIISENPVSQEDQKRAYVIGNYDPIVQHLMHDLSSVRRAFLSLLKGGSDAVLQVD